MDQNADAQFLSAFESCTLPFAQWKHRAHVKVAYLYLCRWPFAHALERVRENIKRYNSATNTPEALDRGYHETMTQAWMRLVHFTLCEHGPAESADAFVDAHLELSIPKSLRLYYSQERLVSWQAKAEFVEPDLAPLPQSKRSFQPEADRSRDAVTDSRLLI